MPVSILHLSDIHFIKDRNVVFQRKEKLFDAIKNELKGSDYIFIITSGDIAYSGKAEEYAVAIDFYKYLYKSINEYTGLKSSLLFVPGNHDCFFNSENDKIRDIILKNIGKEGLGEMSEDIIEICCKPQENYVAFVENVKSHLHYNGDYVFAHQLLNVITFKIKDKIFKFNCYNTSWDSSKNERIGALKFPVDYLYDQIPTSENFVSISIVHHPFNWQSPENSREFREALLKTSEIIISGHEHNSKESLFSDLQQDFSTIYIESPALQETNNDRESCFNIIHIDVNESLLQIKEFSYSTISNIYSVSNNSEWAKLEKNKKLKTRDFQIKKEYKERLENPGASFTHQYVDEIKLSDIYIPPVFNNLSVEKIHVTKFMNFIHADSALNISEEVDSDFFKLIMGSESSGKTALLKYYYLKFYEKKYYPIYLSIEKFTDVKRDKIKTIVATEFRAQYDELEMQFEQIDFRKIILLIDDFHTYKNKKSKVVLINNLKAIYNKIIITGNEVMLFETYTDGKNKTIELFDVFDRFIIQEFNPSLRNQLINKWYRLGREYLDTQEKAIFFKQVDAAALNVNTIIGKNLIPAYPVFILSILQSLETGQSDSTSNNLHAYYYEMLITRSLRAKLKDQDDIGFYMTFAKEYCFFLFDQKIRFKPLSIDGFTKFVTSHSKKYNLASLNIETLLLTLNESRILKTNKDETVSVSYKYLYYYFVAKFLSEDIDNGNTKIIIDRMTDRLYREEYANIVLFLTHLSKSTFVISKLIEKSKLIFHDVPPIKLEEDISFINDLQKDLPEQVMHNLDIEESREQDLGQEDEFELKEREEEEKSLEEDYDLNEDITSIDLISMITKAIRTMNILGQLTKKYWGELLGPDKYNLAEETFMLGLRTLKFNFILLEKGRNEISEHIVKIIQKKFIHDKLSKDQVEAVAANFIFTLSNAASFGVLKRIVNSIGTNKLSNTFSDIQDKHSYNSVMLINAGIKLDHYSGFPINEIEDLKDRNIRNPLAFSTLQNFMIDHFYMYPVAYDLKQKVCEMLNIKIQDQRFIAQTSQIRKK